MLTAPLSVGQPSGCVTETVCPDGSAGGTPAISRLENFRHGGYTIPDIPTAFDHTRLAAARRALSLLMHFGNDLVEGRFVARLNRFAALVDVDGREELVHVANSGRMRELFVPGFRVLLKPRSGEHRKTRFDLALVDLGFALSSADARLPNSLVVEALESKALGQFSEYSQVNREVQFGESRLDLMLEGSNGRCYIETKSVTLVVDGVALFPDAPTERGAKHMRSLDQAVAQGHRAAVVFVVQRPDAVAFAPHETADPNFGSALRHSLSCGVEVFAYNCRVSEQSIELHSHLPVRL